MAMEVDSLDPQVVQELNSINTSPADAKQTAYAALLDGILLQSQPHYTESSLNAYVLNLIGGDISPPGVTQPSESLSIIALRPLLDNFVAKLKASQLSPDIKISVTQTATELLRPRVTSFVQQDTKFKELLADAFEAQEDYTSSARALQSIDLESTQRSVTDAERASIWIRIARCYLEEDNPTDAATYINRVKNIKDNINDKGLMVQFQMSQARIYDSHRQFLEASAAYHAISSESLVDEDDRLQTLSAAIVCAVLAPAGPQRGRMLAKLYKDERTSQVEEYGILEKIFLDRLLAPEEVAAFASKLSAHQLVKTSDGSTVLDRAVLEHNLLGVSRLYRNITIDNLGVLLGVDGDRAEQYAAQMIEQGRLAGHIDQIDRLIFFTGDAAGDKSKNDANTSGLLELRHWDTAVAGVTEEIEKISTMIQTTYPEFYAENVAY